MNTLRKNFLRVTDSVTLALVSIVASTAITIVIAVKINVQYSAPAVYGMAAGSAVLIVAVMTILLTIYDMVFKKNA